LDEKINKLYLREANFHLQESKNGLKEEMFHPGESSSNEKQSKLLRKESNLHLEDPALVS